MANVYWKGGATAVAQVDTFTPVTIEATDIFKLTATGENGDLVVIPITATDTSATTTSGLMIAAWNASTHYLCTGITASGSATVILTADTAGVPFHVSSSTVDGGGNNTQTFARVATIANSGPYDYSTLANWLDSTLLPATNLPGADASDTVYIEGDGVTNPQILYGLNQSAAAQVLTALYATKCQIGSNGSTGKAPSYLQTKATKIEINYNYLGNVVYPTPVNIDNGTTAGTINIYNAGTNTISTEPSINLKIVENTSDVYVYSGRIGIAYHAGEVSTLDNIYILGFSAYVYLGSSVTLTGGMIELRNGYCYSLTAVTIPEVDVYAGNFYQLAAATITALNCVGGITDTTLTSAVVTVTTAKIGSGATLRYKLTDVLTNKVQPYETSGNVQFSSVVAN